ncbi:unnamed protein product, partial [marine sediment metagenome]
LAPGATFQQKVDNLLALGFEGVELNAGFDPHGGSDLRRRVDEIKRALEGTQIAVSSICGGQPMTFLAADVQQRRAAIDGYRENLAIAGELGATGPILVPIFGPPQLSDPWPLKSAVDLEKEILAEICKDLADIAVQYGTNVVLEPLNRYETHLLRTLADAMQICDMAGNPPGLKIMADFFHMNIEEPDIPASIRAAGDAICHVHLADSTRTEPGSGHTDFAAGLKALSDIGYSGYMAFECALSGPDPAEALKRSVKFLQKLQADL